MGFFKNRTVYFGKKTQELETVSRHITEDYINYLISNSTKLPVERTVYLVNSQSDATLMGGSDKNFYHLFQSAYDAANALQISLGGTNVVNLSVLNTDIASVGDLLLTTNFNQYVHINGISKFTSKVGRIDSDSGISLNIQITANNVTIDAISNNTLDAIDSGDILVSLIDSDITNGIFCGSELNVGNVDLIGNNYVVGNIVLEQNGGTGDIGNISIGGSGNIGDIECTILNPAVNTLGTVGSVSIYSSFANVKSKNIVVNNIAIIGGNANIAALTFDLRGVMFNNLSLIGFGGFAFQTLDCICSGTQWTITDSVDNSYGTSIVISELKNTVNNTLIFDATFKSDQQCAFNIGKVEKTNVIFNIYQESVSATRHILVNADNYIDNTDCVININVFDADITLIPYSVNLNLYNLNACTIDLDGVINTANISLLIENCVDLYQNGTLGYIKPDKVTISGQNYGCFVLVDNDGSAELSLAGVIENIGLLNASPQLILNYTDVKAKLLLTDSVIDIIEFEGIVDADYDYASLAAAATTTFQANLKNFTNRNSATIATHTIVFTGLTEYNGREFIFASRGIITVLTCNFTGKTFRGTAPTTIAAGGVITFICVLENNNSYAWYKKS